MRDPCDVGRKLRMIERAGDEDRHLDALLIFSALALRGLHDFWRQAIADGLRRKVHRAFSGKAQKRRFHGEVVVRNDAICDGERTAQFREIGFLLRGIDFAESRLHVADHARDIDAFHRAVGQVHAAVAA